MNRDLFLAILSMDSYNRGYGRGVKLNSSDADYANDEIGARLGAASVTAQIITEEAQAAGFYAIAYNWNGETIIAYRGSDNIDKGAAIANALGKYPIWWGSGFNIVATDDDVTNGYGVAFGYPDGPQAKLAVEFYKAVAGGNYGDTLLQLR